MMEQFSGSFTPGIRVFFHLLNLVSPLIGIPVDRIICELEKATWLLRKIWPWWVLVKLIYGNWFVSVIFFFYIPVLVNKNMDVLTVFVSDVYKLVLPHSMTALPVYVVQTPLLLMKAFSLCPVSRNDRWGWLAKAIYYNCSMQ